MSERKRPLSPHLQIYKPQFSSVTSIFHRFTGVILYFAIIAISWYVVYYAYQINVDSNSDIIGCDCALSLSIKILLYLMALATTFSLYYHLFNGIRHLFWDIGKGFDKETANHSAILVIILSIFLTALTCWFFIYFNFYN
jgi:succinate dehydrogenase / fumarate reductase cytochrome b subunit